MSEMSTTDGSFVSIIAIFSAGALVTAITWAVVRGRAAVVLAAARERAAALEASLADRAVALREAVERESTLRGRLETEQKRSTEFEARLGEATRLVDEERRLLAEAEKTLHDSFRALSGEALKSNNQAFLELARQTFESTLVQVRGEIGKQGVALDALVKPLTVSLGKVDENLRAMESVRQKAFGGLEQQLRSVTETQDALRRETGNLVTALRAPQVRGRWGELTLRRVVELAGLSDHCDFTEQVSSSSEDGRFRPDMIVHLPGGRDIVVDAKTSLSAYLEAIEAGSDEQRKDALKRHAQQLRKHMNSLAGKAYWDQFHAAPEFVVMFIPGESFFAAAVDQEPTIIEDGMANRVVLATPTTLVALLRAVSFGWRQELLAENAQRISESGRELYERVGVFVEHFQKLGKSVENTTRDYNAVLGSLESRVLPSARRLKELGASSNEELPCLEPIE